MSRLSTLDEKNLAPDARAFLDALNSGPRGKLGLIGPFGVWAHAPVVGQAAQAFGAAVRFKTQLPERIKEIAICTVGAHYKAKFEFAAHGPMAIAAGVPPPRSRRFAVGADPELDRRRPCELSRGARAVASASIERRHIRRRKGALRRGAIDRARHDHRLLLSDLADTECVRRGTHIAHDGSVSPNRSLKAAC